MVCKTKAIDPNHAKRPPHKDVYVGAARRETVWKTHTNHHRPPTVNSLVVRALSRRRGRHPFSGGGSHCPRRASHHSPTQGKAQMTSPRDKLDTFFHEIPCKTFRLAGDRKMRAGYRWRAKIAVVPLIVLGVAACSNGPVDRQANVISAETPIDAPQERSFKQDEDTRSPAPLANDVR